MRVLFICAGNLHRSPTAERLYETTPGIEAESAGLSSLARVQVTPELLAWAEAVFVMDHRLLKLLRRRFRAELKGKQVICLRVPDDFQYMAPALQRLLVERLTPHLGRPEPLGAS
jgi:predicted protein tyrosine phosphatase